MNLLTRTCRIALSLLSVSFATLSVQSTSTAASTAPSLDWGRQLGTPADDFGTSVAVEPGGRCYIAGATAGDLGAKNAGKRDVLVAAYAADGQRRWVAQFGTTEDDGATTIALGADDALYVAGATAGKLGLSHTGGNDALLARLDRDGNVIWIRQFGGTAANGAAADTRAAAIVCDPTGTVFLTGTTTGKMAGEPAGDVDVFVAKIGPDGTPLWTRQWGTAATDSGRSLACDRAGNIYVTGSTKGSLPGCTNAGDQDIFVTKLDPAGGVEWTRQFGTPAPESGLHIDVDADGRMYVGASSGGDLAAVQLGGGDAVLLKLSPAGELLWKKQFGTARWDGIHGLAFAPGSTGGVIVGGCQNWDQCQGFLREFDAAGDERWSAVVPTGNVLCGTKIAVDEQGNIYQTGGTHGPAFGEYTGTGNDIILVKLSHRK